MILKVFKVKRDLSLDTKYTFFHYLHIDASALGASYWLRVCRVYDAWTTCLRESIEIYTTSLTGSFKVWTQPNSRAYKFKESKDSSHRSILFPSIQAFKKNKKLKQKSVK